MPTTTRTDLDDDITGEDGDGGVAASSSVIVVGEDRLDTRSQWAFLFHRGSITGDELAHISMNPLPRRR